ncbi:MAG TPA: hypothetical protein VIF14_18895 [Alphaproteobacteria bacterium]|jgi:hypothetical protein
MKTKLLLAAAISALSLGAAGAQAAPVSAPAVNDVATQSTDSAIEQAHHRRFWYGYYYYNYYYSYPYCFYNRFGYYVCRY